MDASQPLQDNFSCILPCSIKVYKVYIRPIKAHRGALENLPAFVKRIVMK